MNKPMRRTLISVAAVGAVIALGLTTTTVVNAVATEAESHRVHAYGEKVPVDGREMNVSISGDGAETIVLLPGFGTASPVLDFQPLITDLAEDHRVIAIEPFGYGLSDGTDRERTTENIVGEVHEALVALNVDSYVLMGHSIAGIYAIEFARRYPEEVTAFVGIDSSVPGQPDMDMQFPTGLLAAAKNLGVLRLITAVGGESLDASTYSDDARDQMRMIANRNSLSPTYLNEMSHISTNFDHARRSSFPEDLPLLLFVVSDNAKNPDWLDLHEQQASAVADGTVVPLPGEHYLHHTHAGEIAAVFREWDQPHSPSAG